MARALLRACCVVLAVLACPFRAWAQSDPVELIFLSVGQGDAAVLRSPEGQTALIDAGQGIDLTPMLERFGIDRLDLVVASHPHADHIGGMWQVLESVPVRYYMDNGQPYTTSTYQAVMQTLEQHEEIVYLEAVPRTLSLGSVSVHVLPLPSYPSSNPNNHSVGLVIEYGEFRAFLSGDSEGPELSHFVRAGVVPDVTVLKAPHHGSNDAVSQTFLEVARPEVVVISVGYGNSYGHPGEAALFWYPRYARDVYRTDVDGHVVVRGFEDGSYEVVTSRSPVAERQALSERPAPETPRVAERRSGGPSDGAAPISIQVVADAPGNDHRNTNGEYAILSNESGQPVDLSGWTLCDAARHCFRFPPSTSVASGRIVVVYTGFGAADGSRFFMGSGGAVWNNDGDTAALYDRSGRLVVEHSY